MRHALARSLASVVAVLLAVSACAGAATPAPATAPSATQAATAAPATAAPATEAPVTEAPVTEEPATAPPVTEPPATEGPPQTPSDQTGHLTVLDWAGYDKPKFWTDFKKNYPNVGVDFEIGASDLDIHTKMSTGDQADIFHPYTGWLQFYVDEGLVEEIDTSQLSNWDMVPDSFKAIGQIDGKQYFIPWDWGFTSVLYRTDRVTAPIDSWAALMDPAYGGHISMWDDGPGAVTVSAYIHGWDETQVTDDQLAQIKQEWIDQKPLNLFYWAGEPDLTQAMQSDDVWAAYAWQGAYATLLGEGVPVAYAQPKEGRNSWVGLYGIRKGTQNKDLAMRFLDEKLGVATGENVVNLFYYGSANQEVMNGITDPALKEAFGIDDPSILESTNFTPNLTADQRDAWGEMWTEVKAAP